MTTLLIDANNLIHRELNNLDNPRKFSNCHPIRKMWLDYAQPQDLVVFVWDGYNSNDRRKQIYPEYKGNRGPKGEDFYAIVKLFQELLGYTSCMQVSVPTYEADDVIFTLAKFFSSQGEEVVVNTTDADYLQMADLPRVTLPCITPWAWDSDLIVTYKALCGDSSDNIPGMPRFGEGAWRNCSTYHETIREALSTKNWQLWSTIAFPKLVQKQCLNKENFEKSCQFYDVISLLTVDLDEVTKHCKTGNVNISQAENLMRKYMI